MKITPSSDRDVSYEWYSELKQLDRNRQKAALLTVIPFVIFVGFSLNPAWFWSTISGAVPFLFYCALVGGMYLMSGRACVHNDRVRVAGERRRQQEYQGSVDEKVSRLPSVLPVMDSEGFVEPRGEESQQPSISAAQPIIIPTNDPAEAVPSNIVQFPLDEARRLQPTARPDDDPDKKVLFPSFDNKNV